MSSWQAQVVALSFFMNFEVCIFFFDTPCYMFLLQFLCCPSLCLRGSSCVFFVTFFQPIETLPDVNVVCDNLGKPIYADSDLNL